MPKGSVSGDNILKLVYPGGFVEIHRKPITAAEVMKRNPRHCVTRPDVFRYPWIVVSPKSVLKPGRVFFIVPYHTIHRLLQSKADRPSPRKQHQEFHDTSDCEKSVSSLVLNLSKLEFRNQKDTRFLNDDRYDPLMDQSLELTEFHRVVKKDSTFIDGNRVETKYEEWQWQKDVYRQRHDNFLGSNKCCHDHYFPRKESFCRSCSMQETRQKIDVPSRQQYFENWAKTTLYGCEDNHCCDESSRFLRSKDQYGSGVVNDQIHGGFWRNFCRTEPNNHSNSPHGTKLKSCLKKNGSKIGKSRDLRVTFVIPGEDKESSKADCKGTPCIGISDLQL